MKVNFEGNNDNFLYFHYISKYEIKHPGTNFILHSLIYRIRLVINAIQRKFIEKMTSLVCHKATTLRTNLTIVVKSH